MVLLKSGKLLISALLVANLHSTMVLLKSGQVKTLLPASDLSTFHYGSIKILWYVVNIAFPITSTFHYGSIKILDAFK